MSADDDLCAAVEKKDAKGATAALAAGASPDARSPTRKISALEMAIALKSKPLVKLLVSKGANLTAFNDDGRNALHLLAYNFPDPAMVELVLDKGVPVDELDKVKFEGKAALHHAVTKKKLDFAELLVKRGADVNVEDSEDGYTPLHQLCKSNSGAMSDTEVANALWLIEKGADIQRATPEGKYTPLHLAASSSGAMTEHLLARGAKITRDKWGNTPLLSSMSTHSRDVARWERLLAAGCQLDDQNETKRTLLMEAQSSWNEFAVKWLVQRGADVTLKDEKGKTVLERAQELKQDKILKVLGA